MNLDDLVSKINKLSKVVRALTQLAVSSQDFCLREWLGSIRESNRTECGFCLH